MSRRSPTRARLDALIFISRPRGVEYDRVATVQAARMDDAQLQEALQRIPARLATARATQDGRALIAVKRYRDALRAEADAREIMAAWAKRNSPRRQDRARAAEGRAVWAMRQLQALAGAEEELRKVRVHLCVAARDSGLTLREVAEVAGTTHPTVQKWTRSPAPFARKSQGDTGQPPWVPDDDALRQIAREAGINDGIVASLLGEVEAGDDGEAD